MSARSLFYSRFVPRTVDRGDLAAHCNDMLRELDDGQLSPVPTNVQYDECDEEDERDEEDEECEEDECDEVDGYLDQCDATCTQPDPEEVETARKTASRACVQARIAVGLGENDVAFGYHQCCDMYRTWKYMYEVS